MRTFRIPNFSGIEAHRDDADRGTLRVCEGCLPSGPGGLRSAPVWSSIGAVDKAWRVPENAMYRAYDDNGNEVYLVNHAEQTHGIRVFPSGKPILKLGWLVDVTTGDTETAPVFPGSRAILSSVGSRSIAWGNGQDAARFTRMPQVANLSSTDGADKLPHRLEWADFPKCKFFVVGPKKTIFAAGNEDDPLAVYVSEPAGLTNPVRDAIYSTDLSVVRILKSDATKITALSRIRDQVIVHTDAEAHVLYAPAAGQDETGYRVKQAASSVASAAVSQAVVAGVTGSLNYYLGHDGQIYKDEATTRGAELKETAGDTTQASWKAKGLWDKELPSDLSDAFATYDPESGCYWLFVGSGDVAGNSQLSIYQNWANANLPPGNPSITANTPPGVPIVLSDVTPGVPTILRGVSTPGAPQFGTTVTAPGSPVIDYGVSPGAPTIGVAPFAPAITSATSPYPPTIQGAATTAVPAVPQINSTATSPADPVISGGALPEAPAIVPAGTSPGAPEFRVSATTSPGNPTLTGGTIPLPPTFVNFHFGPAAPSISGGAFPLPPTISGLSVPANPTITSEHFFNPLTPCADFTSSYPSTVTCRLDIPNWLWYWTGTLTEDSVLSGDDQGHGKYSGTIDAHYVSNNNPVGSGDTGGLSWELQAQIVKQGNTDKLVKLTTPSTSSGPARTYTMTFPLSSYSAASPEKCLPAVTIQAKASYYWGSQTFYSFDEWTVTVT